MSNPNDLRAAADRGAAAERELAFLKAGIDTSTGAGRLLLETYQGRLTKDAILAHANSYGINAGSGSNFSPITDEERSQTRERAALATESEFPGGLPDPDPHRTGLREFQRAREEGAPVADASAEYFNRVLEAAYVKKDPRAIFNQDQWKADNAGSSRAR